MSISIEMSAALNKGLHTMLTDFGHQIIDMAAKEYGFDAKDAYRLIPTVEFSTKKAAKKVSSASSTASSKKKKSLPKPECPLPFLGQINYDYCLGIKFNYGLHTQCRMVPSETGEYCATCQKMADKNSNGKPDWGDIRDRLTCPLLEFRDPKGKQTLPYANVIKSKKIEEAKWRAEAEKFGLEIPDEQLVLRQPKRGRPKNSDSVSVSDSDSTASGLSGAKKDVLDELTAAADSASTASSGASSKKSKKGRPSKVPDHYTGSYDSWQEMTGDERKVWKKENPTKEQIAAKAAKEAERAAKKADKEAEKAAK